MTPVNNVSFTALLVILHLTLSDMGFFDEDKFELIKYTRKTVLTPADLVLILGVKFTEIFSD